MHLPQEADSGSGEAWIQNSEIKVDAHGVPCKPYAKSELFIELTHDGCTFSQDGSRYSAVCIP